jgi:hypothetical protein
MKWICSDHAQMKAGRIHNYISHQEVGMQVKLMKVGKEKN